MVMNKKSDCFRNVFQSAFLVITLIVFINLSTFHQVVDASCLFREGQLGECVKFEDCPSAASLSRKGINLGYCNVEERTVCCPDYKRTNSFQRPSPEIHSSNSNGRRQSYVRDPHEDEVNTQRIKHSISKQAGSNSAGKKRNNYNNYEEPCEFEIPYQESEISNKPVRRPASSNSPTYIYQSEENPFVPPGLAKKKTWREEKTTENDYYFEHVTKKPNRGPPRKNPGKHNGHNNSKRTEQTTRRNDWSDGDSNYDSYDGQNDYERESYNYRPTTKRNKWVQETYTTTKRNDYYGSGNNYGADEDEYYNLKPSRKPQRPSSGSGFPQESRPQGNNRPGNHQGPKPQDNYRPDYHQSSRPNEQNRPEFEQGSRPQGSNRPINYPGSRPQENNRPGYQQGSRPSTGNQQGSGSYNNRPNSGPQKRKRISDQKCEEYTKHVTENITGLPLTTNPDPVIIPVRKCITPQQLIVGGENTTLGEFPHMAAIGFHDKNKNQISWNCGGTLISDLFVLTAAHCTLTHYGPPVKVRLGEYNLKKNDDGAHPVDYTVKGVINHPEYRPPSKYNDIALLKLSRRVTFYKNILPACLYSEGSLSVSKAVATGWGRIHFDSQSGSDLLQKVVLSIVDNNTCNRFYKSNIKSEQLSRGIVDTQLCAGELSGGKDTCQGDSGGPLSITNTKCIHHIIGITSFGRSCALPNSTGVYTRVSAFVPWIESIVWPTDYN